MNVDTGELISVEELKKKTPEEQKKFVELSRQQVAEIQGMNRAQRRRWAKDNRKKLKKKLRQAG